MSLRPDDIVRFILKGGPSSVNASKRWSVVSADFTGFLGRVYVCMDWLVRACMYPEYSLPNLNWVDATMELSPQPGRNLSLITELAKDLDLPPLRILDYCNATSTMPCLGGTGYQPGGVDGLHHSNAEAEPGGFLFPLKNHYRVPRDPDIHIHTITEP